MKVEVFVSKGCVYCPTMVEIVKHIAGEENCVVTDVSEDPGALERMVVGGEQIKTVPSVIIDGVHYTRSNVRKLELKLESLFK